MPETDQPLLAVDGLEVEYHTRHRTVRAVQGATFDIRAGETLGLVGESGSGKTTIGRAILGLVPINGGTVTLRGRDITRANRRERRNLASELQAIFQDPYGSFNPALKVGASLLEAMPADQPRAVARDRMRDLLERVGLPWSAAEQYPSRFSGGQRQRLAVARALMASPSLIICDEPVSALDVSIQAQVLNLLKELQREFSLAYLFIGHDLDVMRFMSDRIVVLYRGHILEQGPADAVVRTPRSPYTQALLEATRGSRPEAPSAAVPAVSRTEPHVGAPDAGCPFADRCSLAVEICRSQMPALEPASGGGVVACHRYHDAVGRVGGPAGPPDVLAATASEATEPRRLTTFH